MKNFGFTLIELMIVMFIVALLMSIVGPMAINSVEKAQAKQEMLTVKNWLRKISHRAFTTGKVYQLSLEGKKAELYIVNENHKLVRVETLEYVFFSPQILTFSQKGFVTPEAIQGTFRGNPLLIDLSQWVNGIEIVPSA